MLLLALWRLLLVFSRVAAAVVVAIVFWGYLCLVLLFSLAISPVLCFGMLVLCRSVLVVILFGILLFVTITYLQVLMCGRSSCIVWLGVVVQCSVASYPYR